MPLAPADTLRKDASHSTVGATPQKPGRARFADIAAEAGVSEATVDRVLNERGKVSYAAREKVISAAMRLGTRGILPEVRHGLRHIDVILPKNDSFLYRRLALALRRTAQSLRKDVVIHPRIIDRTNDTAYARAIGSPPYRRSGVIVIGDNATPTIDALGEANARGERVISMVTELPHSHYVGVDNMVSGAVAGHMIGKLTRGEGRVLVLRGFHRSTDHDQRVAGCLKALSGSNALHEIEIPTQQTGDEAEMCFRLVEAAMRQGPVAAIYNTGCGNTGVHEALRRRALLGKIVWVTHEMHGCHAGWLKSDHIDLVIDQQPDAQLRSALQHVLGDDMTGGMLADAQTPLNTHLFTMANVPDLAMAI